MQQCRKGVMGNGGLRCLDWSCKVFQNDRRKQHKHVYLCFQFFLAKTPRTYTNQVMINCHMTINWYCGIFLVLWENLCWNSCMGAKLLVAGTIISRAACYLLDLWLLAILFDQAFFMFSLSTLRVEAENAIWTCFGHFLIENCWGKPSFCVVHVLL